MQISLKSSDALDQIRTACLVVAVTGGDPAAPLRELDRAVGGQLIKLRDRGDLGDEVGQTLLLPAVAGIKAERLLLVSLGKTADELSESDFRKAVNAVLAVLAERKVADACWSLPALAIRGRETAWALRELAQLATLREYRYTETVSKPKPALALRKLTLMTDSSEAARQAVRVGRAIGNGMNAARRLGDLPPNICTPTFLAKEAKALATRKGDTAKSSEKTSEKTSDAGRLKVSVLDEKQMGELGMGALLSVTAGTEQPARLIVVEYRGGGRAQPQVLVGKGITFDSGGISLKPGAKMDEMKYDMCGAASVIGTLSAIIELQLPINVIGVIAAAENLPSGRATKPGDVVRSMSGQTIEILNTDAEGRLMLCDALTYVERYKPAAVIDIATLTGACVVALGKHASGLFSPDDALADSLLAAGQRTGDRAWRLPVWDDYQKSLDSNFADMANIGGPGAGSITAACFLARFTRDYRWAHLDIAGTAWDEGSAKGATGRPVPLLTDYLLQLTLAQQGASVPGSAAEKAPARRPRKAAGNKAK